MGYGEFDGGGSVKWVVEHTNHDDSRKKGKGARGRDLDPPDAPDPRDVMAVWVNGTKISTVKCKGTKIVVAWGADAQGPNPPSHPTPDD